MVRIRLRRVGAKKQPSFRIIAADKESPRDGKFLEILGHYNPRTEPATIVVKEDRVYEWIKNGAQPSDSVNQLFRTIGADERIKRMKAGEDVEKLLAEAVAAADARVVDPRTRRDAPAKAKPAAKVEEAPVAEVEAEDAPVEEAPVAEVEVEETPAEEAPVAEVEAEETPAEDAPAEEVEKNEKAAE